jgi:hypothetical protein
MSGGESGERREFKRGLKAPSFIRKIPPPLDKGRGI